MAGGPPRHDLVSVVEAGYRLDATDEQWLRDVGAGTSALLGDGSGAVALYFDTSRAPEAWVQRGLALGANEQLAASVPQLYAAIPLPLRLKLLSGSPALTAASRMLNNGDSLTGFGPLAPLAQQYGIDEALGLCVADVSGAGFVIGSIRGKPAWIAPAMMKRWQRVAAHLAAGLRLRRAIRADNLESGEVPCARAEAVLEAGGRVVHAEAAAAPRDLREALRAAVRARDRARSAAGRRDEGTALDLWQALVSGRWSLVDRFEADGRRFTVAIENQPRATDPRALSARERAVVQLAARGHANKSIAYSLGLAEGTIGTLLSRASRKLGLASRAELAYWAGAWQGGARWTAPVDLGGASLGVAASGAIDDARGARLAARDGEVARAVARGDSNAEIARALGCSVRAVARRLARLYAKLELGSRAELAGWLARPGHANATQT